VFQKRNLSYCIGIAVALIVVTEAALGIRSLTPIQASDAPVFSWQEVMQEPAERSFASSIRSYGADDGRRKDVIFDDGVRLTAFYFEWARTEMGPLMDLKGHPPEVCNVAAGLTFLGLGPERHHLLINGERLLFDITRFKDPSGQTVHVFKCAWVQGVGGLVLRRSETRLERMKSTLIRHAGAARVVQGGVFNAASEDHAWSVFEREVLAKLVCLPG